MNVKAFEQFCRIGHNTRAIGFKDGFQTRWGGEPYFDNHCVPVKEIAIASSHTPKQSWVIEIVSCVAFGHDLLEDTDVTIKELKEVLLPWTASYYDISVIIQAIRLLTKNKDNFDLFVYLNRIKNNMFALPVKLADNQHNTDDLIKLKNQLEQGENIVPNNIRNKIEKYQLIRYYLLH